MGDRHDQDWRTGGSAAPGGARSGSLFWKSPTIRSLNPRRAARPLTPHDASDVPPEHAPAKEAPPQDDTSR